MPRKLLITALLCLATAPLLAADPPAAKAAAKRPPVVKPVAKEQANPPEELLPRTVFGVLLGEFALQRGKLDIALGAYVDIAKRTQDPLVIRRAIEIAMHTRQFELALELSRLWQKAEPNSPEAQQSLTTALMLLNRTDELGGQIARMLESDKSRLVENLLFLNRMLARQPDRQAVNRLVEKVATPYAHLPEAHYAMGVAALSANDMARARSESIRALEMRPDWERAVLLRAQVLAKDSLLDALPLLQEFVAANPNAADARLNLARLLLTAKRDEEAREQFSKVLESYPESPEALFPAAMLALKQNDLAAGRKLLERLLASPHQDKSTVHYFLGQLDEEEKNPDSALAHYRMVIAGEQYMAARTRAAQLMAQTGRSDAALKLLSETKAVTAEEKVRLALAEAALLRDAKRYKDAYARLEIELKTQPENTELLYDAAMVAERLGKVDVMERHLQHLLTINPEHAHALNALGYTLADQNKRLDEAHRLIAKALALAPKDPFIMDSMGWVLYRQGKLTEAQEMLATAYRQKPDPEIAAHLGEVLWKLDRRDEARSLWKTASESHPDNETLVDIIKKFQP